MDISKSSIGNYATWVYDLGFKMKTIIKIENTKTANLKPTY